MRLTVVGSGDACNSAGRGHSCYWLDGLSPADDAPGLMVDFGATALMGLRRIGRVPEQLGTILFTHLHGDHIGGFPYLLVDALHGETLRRAPLEVIGPLGVRERLEALMQVAYGSLARKERGFALRWQELAPGDDIARPWGRVQGFAADHQDPPERPLCLRVTAETGETVAFSGDTRLCDGLREAARDVDLLVAECTHLAPPAGRHTTWQDWRTELATIRARRVLLTHLSSSVRARTPELLAQAPPGVELGFAEDGLVVDV